MKKITLLLMLFATSLWQVNAQFTQGFETGIDAGWTIINNGSANGWVQNTTPSGGAQEGSAVASITYNSDAHDDYLITPQIAVVTGTNDFLSFYVKSRSSSYLEPYEVLLSTTGTAAADFTVTLQASSTAPNSWTDVSLDLSAYNGQSVYVAIKATGTDQFQLFVDNVVNGVEPTPPNCASNPTPADGATNIPNGAITLTWDAPTTGPTPTSYDLLAGSQSDGSDLTLVGNYTTNTAEVTVTGYDTTIYWRIVPKNGSVEATGCDLWSLTTGPQPPAPGNNLPAGAITLTLDEGTACGANAITGISNESTTDSGDGGTPSCGSYTGATTYGDLWYKFTAASVSVTLNTQNVTGISSVAGAYYSGTPGSFTEEGCTEFSSGWPWTLTGLTVGQEYYLRVWDYGNNSLGTFDLCGYYATCIAPTALSASTTQSTEAEISWTAGDSETAWEYVVQAQGTGTPSSSGTATTNNPTTVTGLTEGDSYEFYVRANCGSGDFSEWVGPFNWTQTVPPANDTLAGAIPITPSPAGTGCTTYTFSNSTANDGTTDSGLDGTCNATNTGLDRFYSWTATTDALIWNDGAGNPGVVIRDASGTQIVCSSTYAADDYVLSGWNVGDNLIIQVYDFGTSDVDTSFCLEEYTLPTCPDPSALTATNLTETTADIGWTLGGTETTWEYVVQAPGTGVPTGAGTATTTNPTSLTGLTGETAYEFYVRASCGGGDFSNWVGPVSFTTDSAPLVPDYTNDFETFPGVGWTEAQGPYGSPSGATSSWATDDYGNVTGNKAARVNIWSSSVDEYLISPAFNLSGGTYYLNYDVALTEYANTNSTTLGSDDYVALLVTQDAGATWTELTRYDATTPITATRQTAAQITLTGYGSNVKFAFYANSGANDAGVDNDFFIDNFNLTSAALSVDTNIIEGFKLYPNPVKDKLFLNAQDTIEEVTLYNMLGQRVVSITPNVLNTSLPLTELNTGMYIVKVKIGNQLGTYRIVKE